MEYIGIYELEIQFSDEALDQITEAKQRVVVQRWMDYGDSNVAWQSFKPFNHNRVVWNNSFGLFAASSFNQDQAIFRVADVASASKTHEYPLSDSGYFMTPDAARVKGYGVVNRYSEPAGMYFGATQIGEINGKQIDSELNATYVLYNNSAEFNPTNKAIVYLESDTKKGFPIFKVIGQPIVLDFGQASQHSTNTTKSIFYDTNSGQFVEGTLPD
ncbi:hypothetical protein DFA_00119 [Cavenderia fasciculata]|uniref:Uncharacterized protein n=1 Tax=Cavenderia fasciculata TaxID=261658 RepID=F4PXN1_CACFS|nr:uncharacterized protein DFA_00119 [Cavenderia fasciculata]EGG19541.1 hypothetical protein DFA_00119 [Cavenderia fasciculata]|eukprot:XP_004357835.1 hypothetical protein DFA_00119 [Cavenderia fasciculata]